MVLENGGNIIRVIVDFRFEGCDIKLLIVKYKYVVGAELLPSWINLFMWLFF